MGAWDGWWGEGGWGEGVGWWGVSERARLGVGCWVVGEEGSVWFPRFLVGIFQRLTKLVGLDWLNLV